MRIAAVLALSALLPAFLCGNAHAQATCGPLKILDIVHMIPTVGGDTDVVPVFAGGKARAFLLDTGGFLSQISRPLAKELGLSIMQGRQEMFDAVGNVSRDQTRIKQFRLGEITMPDVALMISPALSTSATPGIDGLLAPDLLIKYDLELDFENDTMNLFSPDHCPGHVVYWQAPVVATVPISLEQPRFSPDHRERQILSEVPVTATSLGAHELDGFHIYVTVMLDGHPIKALVDTGATVTALRDDIARRQFGLTLGDADTPKKGVLNGEADLTTYDHRFKQLSFGPVSVDGPRIAIIPNAMGRNLSPQPLAADRTKTERDLVNAPDLILGMDMLRRFRLYFAFQEGKLYVSPAASGGGAGKPYSPEFVTAMLTRLDQVLTDRPDDADALNDRCFWRGIARTELDGALADCDKSLKLNPNNAQTLDSRAFVLYQQGKYQDALDAYSLALKSDPNQAPSLWMRGLAKGKLGDTAGKDADVALAVKGDPNIAAEFKRIGIEN